jgi:hypothetical protein
MSTVMALKLGRQCPHCGEQLTVAFTRDLSKPDKPLMAAVVHGLIEHLSMDIDWQPVNGLDDVTRLPEPSSHVVPW